MPGILNGRKADAKGSSHESDHASNDFIPEAKAEREELVVSAGVII